MDFMGRGEDNLINKLQERPVKKEAGNNYEETAELFSLLGVARRNGHGFFVVQNLGERAKSVIATVGSLENRPLAYFELGEDNLGELLEGGLADVFEQPFLVHIKSDGMHDEEFANLARALNESGEDRVATLDGVDYPLHDDLIVFLESNNMNSEYHPAYADEALVIGETWLEIEKTTQARDDTLPFRKIADYKKAGQSFFASKDRGLARETAAISELPYFELDGENTEELKHFEEIKKRPSVVYLKANRSEDILDHIRGNNIHDDSFVFIKQDKSRANAGEFVFIEDEE
jgi:hypothetical protein